MLFFPKASKFKKYQKGIIPNKLKNIWNLKDYKKTRCVKLITKSFGNINTKQLTAIRFLIKKFIKKRGIVRFSTFPNRSVTKKPSEVRMGKGKGSFSHWSSSLNVGVTICEIFCKNNFKRKLLKILKRVRIRLPIKTKIIF